jgi:hypothetical protein
MRCFFDIRSRASITLLLCLLASLTAKSAGAQFFQYTPPGGPEQQPESRKEELERQIDKARYRLGPFHIAPWAALHDVSYVRNFFATGIKTPSDLTATAGAGFRAYLHNGRKAAWAFQVLPEYVWWRDQAERRQLNGRYLVSYYGFFNRLTLEVRGGREQQQRLVTPELPVPVSARRDLGEVLAEVQLTPTFHAFATSAFNWQNNLVEDSGIDPRVQELRLLDREERVTRAGLRWLPGKWSVGLGAERSEVDFDHGTLDRSNAGTAPVAEVRFRGRRVAFETDLAARSLEARQGAQFVPYDRVTGNASLRLGSESHVSTNLYASRNLVYSLERSYAYLTDDRLGLSVTSRLGRRAQGRVFVEQGTEGYTAYLAGAPEREDDLTSYGASVIINLRGGFNLTLQGLRARFDSNIPGGDRNYSLAGATIDFLGFQ